MMRRLAIALEIIPRHPAELLNRLRGTRLQRARNGRLLGTPRPPKGALHRWIENSQRYKPGNEMPDFPALRGSQLDALVAYLEGLK